MGWCYGAIATITSPHSCTEYKGRKVQWYSLILICVDWVNKWTGENWSGWEVDGLLLG